MTLFAPIDQLTRKKIIQQPMPDLKEYTPQE
jgi:hypothetical protein